MPTATSSTPGMADSPDGVPVEAEDLFGASPGRHDGHVDREHLPDVDARLRRLQREQRLEQRAGSGEERNDAAICVTAKTRWRRVCCP